MSKFPYSSKMRNSSLLIFLYIFTFTQISYAQKQIDQGLYFSSHEVIQEKRTSLNLTPKESLQFKDKFIIDFEVNFRHGDGFYGNILKITGNNSLNIDLVANLVDDDENFWLTVNDKVLFVYKWSDIPKSGYDKWMKFSLEFDLEKSQLTMGINGIKFVKPSKEIGNISDFNFIFGESIYTKFSTTDVCPMSVKKVRIHDKTGKLVRDWDLGKHTKTNKVYDNVVHDEAVALNPKWLIDQHLFWNKSKDFTFDKLLGIARDDKGGRIFFIDSKIVQVYSVINGTIVSYPYKENSIKCQSTSFIYNEFKKELIAYSIDENNYSVFDFTNLKWSHLDSDSEEKYYTQHNKIISPKDGSLMTFGGYGHYMYKSQIKKFTTGVPKLYSKDLSGQIAPRYLSSSGILNSDTFLIFGGYGSNTGKQGVNSQFYYDLYTVDFKDLKVKKLWESNEFKLQPFVPVQSMVVDKNTDSFYTMIYNNTIYNTSLKLARFGLESKEMSVFADSIPYEFLDIKSDADFFLTPQKSKLYTITSLKNKVSIFSLAYPPLAVSDVYQTDTKTNAWPTFYWITGLLILIVLFFIIRKFRKESKKDITVTEDSNNETIVLEYPKSEKIKKSAIYLFGGFQVYDNDGNDITALFTPTIKELFLLILLSSAKKDKGISSKKLTEFLWPNKTESNARNNRNVNISKLRLLLEKIGDIDISNDNTYWQINKHKSVFCDYIFVIEKLEASKFEVLTKKQIYEILNIISRGEIYPDIQNDWIEDYKTKISNTLIEDLYRISKTQDDLNLLVLISTVILKYDPLNEESIVLLCKSLYASGRKGLAKQSYNQFCKEYLEVLDAKYDVPFNAIIS